MHTMWNYKLTYSSYISQRCAPASIRLMDNEQFQFGKLFLLSCCEISWGILDKILVNLYNAMHHSLKLMMHERSVIFLITEILLYHPK